MDLKGFEGRPRPRHCLTIELRLMRFGEFSLILDISATNERKGRGFALSFCFLSIGDSLLIGAKLGNQKPKKKGLESEKHPN